ncbi:TIR domain-containing adapter molecule 1 [Zootoca vivipara]|uniref:TIR domain-containing adapter molecule 1 n=1 Tax=Zootoca vivipara TaxID=8524 RepID=UPI00159202C6|nr:TIR domain-containing adapter molecule 1 [Zootoca vivipara]XP_034974860.1 TIR domain-containing adapter molecule 1 [Zootoca vivipara]XP_034974861.1 TIR domain-containing adapter molecule 1 [Zootoca vivipara]XP_034974863.1 TIR domain-containing adapter molecule 1 [Zootoca vivipara]XP_034974864.1 TIR domain-containing adapter molecule 1 [Zootoca vivipara]XP_060131365.1 TIR domain-containing adapter molecule 1 [Zootoca vivipara]
MACRHGGEPPSAATLPPLQAPRCSSNWGVGLAKPFAKTAEGCTAPPSMEGIFRVLATIPGERLVQYKHKLSYSRQGGKSCRLLQAMILLTLGRETEARLSLEALENCAAVADIYKNHQQSSAASRADPAPLNQDAEVALAVARIYSLLVEEKLCGPLARDEAYRIAIKAFLESDVPRSTFESLLSEAQQKCGLDFMPAAASNTFSTPRCGVGRPPSGAAKSSPMPVLRSWAPSEIQPLRSTGSPASLLSHLEISQSPTLPFLTHSIQHGVPEPSKLCGSGPGSLVQQGEGGAAVEFPANSCSGRPAEPVVQDQEKTRQTSDSRGNHSGLSVQPPHKSTQPLEDGENREPRSLVASEPQGCAGGSFQNSQAPPTPLPGLALSATFVPRTVEDSSSPKQSLETGSSSSSGPPPPRSSGPPSTDLPAEEQPFFTFVVVHAPEDETVACQVRERLEALGVADGATVSEDFLVPGHCQLSCFQDALDNSAFTLLLMTENFKSRFCAFQANVALMDSFQRFCKTNSVVPFIAKESPMKRREMPCLLAAIVPLDETSPVFARRVKKTFSPAVIREKRALWDISRQIRNQERLKEQQSDYSQALQRLLALRVSSQGPMPSQRGFLGLQAPPDQGSQPFFYSERPQPQLGPDQLSHPYVFSRGSPGLMSGAPPSHLIIQNAQMVQIGDYNQMQVEKAGAAAALSAEEEEGGSDGRERPGG